MRGCSPPAGSEAPFRPRGGSGRTVRRTNDRQLGRGEVLADGDDVHLMARSRSTVITSSSVSPDHHQAGLIGADRDPLQQLQDRRDARGGQAVSVAPFRCCGSAHGCAPSLARRPSCCRKSGISSPIVSGAAVSPVRCRPRTAGTTVGQVVAVHRVITTCLRPVVRRLPQPFQSGSRRGRSCRNQCRSRAGAGAGRH